MEDVVVRNGLEADCWLEVVALVCQSWLAIAAEEDVLAATMLLLLLDCCCCVAGLYCLPMRKLTSSSLRMVRRRFFLSQLMISLSLRCWPMFTPRS